MRPTARALTLAFAVLLAPTLAAGQFAAPQVVKLAYGGPTRAPAGKPFTVTVLITVTDGYHIQADKPAPNYIPTRVTVTAPKGFRVDAPVFPKPTTAKVVNETIPVFAGKVQVRVRVTPPASAKGPQKLSVKVDYQACNAQTCFPPAAASATGTIALGGATKAEQDIGPTTVASAGQEPPPADGALPGYRESRITQFVKPAEFVKFLAAGSASEDAGAGTLSRLLKGGNLLLALPLIFVLGLALNLTPCVYPLIPITIGYFGGQAQAGRKPIVLALFYVLGMALMYSALGVAAGLGGAVFGSQLQAPWVLVVFALLMFALALSQFDRPNGMPIWELQLPAGLRNRAQARSGIAGAMLMGLMVGVVAAPCVGPAVVALLQWVGQQRSAPLGFAVFFTLAVGLGLPYLFLASVSGSIRKLPRSGDWMMGVKHIFGVILAWMGFYYLQNILNGVRPGLGGGILIAVTAAGGIYLLFIDRAGATARVFYAVKRLVGVGALAGALWLAIPAPSQQIHWQPYSEAAIAQAQAVRKPILVDFTANWCAACKELEHQTFTHPEVGKAASGYLALRADLSDSGYFGQMSKRYRIVGLPTVLRLVPE